MCWKQQMGAVVVVVVTGGASSAGWDPNTGSHPGVPALVIKLIYSPVWSVGWGPDYTLYRRWPVLGDDWKNTE